MTFMIRPGFREVLLRKVLTPQATSSMTSMLGADLDRVSVANNARAPDYGTARLRNLRVQGIVVLEPLSPRVIGPQ